MKTVGVGVEVDNFLDSLRSARTKEVYSGHRKRFLEFVSLISASCSINFSL